MKSNGPSRRTPSSRQSQGASRRKKTSEPRRKRGSSIPPWVAPLVIVPVVLLVGYFAYQAMKPNPIVAMMQDAIELRSRAMYDEAIAILEQIPNEKRTGKVQELLDETIALKEGGERRVTERFAENLYQRLVVLKATYVDRNGQGHLHPDYVSSCRYLLLNAKEYLDTYPDGPHVEQVRGYFSYYRNVASLETPPTFNDVRVEIEHRHGTREWSQALTTLNAFAVSSQSGQNQVEELRDLIRERALDHWNGLEEHLKSKYMQPGKENWRMILKDVRQYLEGVEGMPELSVGAQALHDLAVSNLEG